MMNPKAMKRMEQFAQTVINAPKSAQNAVWAALADILTPNEINGLKRYTAAYRLMTDNRYYMAVQNAVCEQVWKEAQQ